MLNMTKVSAAAMGVALAASLVACGGSPSSQAGGSTKTSEETSQKGTTSSTSKDTKSTESTKTGSKVVSEPLENQYAQGVHHARIEVKDYGTIDLELDADTAPITVSNFGDLVDSKFYDGLTFHRIMQGFMIQGGDPDGNGTGGADRSIKGEFSENGVKNGITHKRGTVSMARSQDPDSASSQFFICDSDSDTFLDGQYAGFGHVTKGMDVVDAIAAAAKPSDGNGTIPSSSQPVIQSIRMLD